MKKFLIALLAVTIGLTVFAGCNEDVENPEAPLTEITSLSDVEKVYSTISQSIAIEQKIEIKSGELLRYEDVKNYVKSESGYAVTETVKQLNDLDADLPYSTSESEYTVAASAEVTFKIGLKQEYFTSIKLDGGVLSADVKDGCEDDVFALDDAVAPVHNMKLKVTTDKLKIASLEVTYVTGSSNVTISMAFTY